MTTEQLKGIFPNASKDFLEENADDYRDNSKLPSAKPKCNQAAALDTAVPGKAKGTDKIAVSFTGYRVFPLDPDNFAGGCKDLLDGLRHSKLIPGDEAWRITLECEQKKVTAFTKEKTVIRITYP